MLHREKPGNESTISSIYRVSALSFKFRPWRHKLLSPFIEKPLLHFSIRLATCAIPYFLELLDLGEQETRLCRNLNQNVCEAVQPSISSSLKPMKDNNGFLLFLISFVRSDAALCCWLILLSLETYEILIHSSFAILTFSSYKNKTSKQQFSKSCVSRRLGRKNQQSLLPMYLCSLNLNKINWWSALIYF